MPRGLIDTEGDSLTKMLKGGEMDIEFFWNEQAGLLNQIRNSGGFSLYTRSLPDLNKAFEADNCLRCIDEGTENGLHSAGSGVVFIRTYGFDKGFEGYEVINEGVEAAAEAFQNSKLESVSSHQECGAAALIYSLFPDSLKESLNRECNIRSSDDFGDFFAAKLAETLSVRYNGRVSLKDMSRPPGYHIARVTYVDGTGKFNPSAIKGLPRGFVISRGYLGSYETTIEAEISMNIAAGNHGFGNRIDRDNPHFLVVVGDPRNPEMSTEKLSQELRQLAYNSNGKVIIDGFKMPYKG